MPRYFFDIHDGEAVIDEEGTELPDFEAARREATSLFRPLQRKRSPTGRIGSNSRS
jgi:hypothetical protein